MNEGEKGELKGKGGGIKRRGGKGIEEKGVEEVNKEGNHRGKAGY